MDPVTALERLGGTASSRDLLALTSRRALRRACGDLSVRHVGRDRYALPAPDQGRRTAQMLNGYMILLTAAMHHGWKVRFAPPKPQIGLPRRRELIRTAVAEVHRVDLRSGDVAGLATTHLQTVLACARELPFADALAVADSALRSGDVCPEELKAAARGSARVERVAEHATACAANPFESSLRAILIEEGIGVIAQYEVRAGGLTVHPDLVDPIAGVVFEAESWEFHGRDKAAFESDCERYNALVATGWRVLRFTWQQVMLDPDHVRRCVRALYREL